MTARYVCAHAKALYGTATTCQSIGGRRLEQQVCDEVFAVLAPAALAATAKALAEAESHHAARLKTFELAVERAGYEAQRAQTGDRSRSAELHDVGRAG